MSFLDNFWGLNQGSGTDTSTGSESVLDKYRVSRDARAAKEQEAKDAANDYNNELSKFAASYLNWAGKKGGGKYSNEDISSIIDRTKNMVKALGIADKKLARDASDVDIAKYGTKYLRGIANGDSEDSSFEYYVKNFGSDDLKNALSWQDTKDRMAQMGIGSNNNFLNAFREDNDEKAAKAAIKQGKKDYEAWKSNRSNDLYDLFENYDDWSNNTLEGRIATGKFGLNFLFGDDESTASSDKKKPMTFEDIKKDYESNQEKLKEAKDAYNKVNSLFNNMFKGKSSGGSESSSDDVVEFTLPKANDPNYKGFGQKIIDLGLATDHGLWGADGDVEFYTKQLYDQGALDERGNLKIGVPIKLKRRKNKS